MSDVCSVVIRYSDSQVRIIETYFPDQLARAFQAIGLAATAVPF